MLFLGTSRHPADEKVQGFGPILLKNHCRATRLTEADITVSARATRAWLISTLGVCARFRARSPSFLDRQCVSWLQPRTRDSAHENPRGEAANSQVTPT